MGHGRQEGALIGLDFGLQIFGFPDGQAEMSPLSRSQDTRSPGARAAWTENHQADARRRRGTQNRAYVAGVLDSIEQNA